MPRRKTQAWLVRRRRGAFAKLVRALRIDVLICNAPISAHAGHYRKNVRSQETGALETTVKKYAIILDLQTCRRRNTMYLVDNFEIGVDAAERAFPGFEERIKTTEGLEVHPAALVARPRWRAVREAREACVRG